MAGLPADIVIAYQTALAAHQQADDHLSALLRAAYGCQAADMRQQPPETEAIAHAMRIYYRALDRRYHCWLAILAAERKTFTDTPVGV